MCTLDVRREDGERMGSLLETKEKYTDEIMSREGVIGIAVGKEAIMVFVEEGKTITPEIPAQLDGWPVVVIPTEPFVHGEKERVTKGKDNSQKAI